MLEPAPISSEIRAVIIEIRKDPEQLANLAARVAKRIRADVPDYANIPEALTRDGTMRNISEALTYLIEGEMPSSDNLRQTAAVAVERARQGLSLANILAGYRAGAWETWTLLTNAARERGVSDADLIDAMAETWRWLENVTVAAAHAYREVELAAIQERDQRLGETLAELLVRPGPAETVTRLLDQMGFETDHAYTAISGRLSASGTIGRLRAFCGEKAMIAPTPDRGFLGLISDPARVEEIPAELGTVGVGPSVAPSGLHTSYLAANRAMRTALKLDRSGVHRLDDLRLAAAAVEDHYITPVLAERLIEPLRGQRTYAREIWQAVVAYLRHGLRVEDAASELHVHGNTMRHRLARYTELTGVDFHNTADIAELWWLAAARPDGPNHDSEVNGSGASGER